MFITYNRPVGQVGKESEGDRETERCVQNVLTSGGFTHICPSYHPLSSYGITADRSLSPT